MGNNPKPPVLSPGSSVYPSKVVKLYAGNLPSWATEVKISSPAFQLDEQHPTTFVENAPTKTAVAELMIGDVDPGSYPVTLHFGAFSSNVGVTVEPADERAITTLLTRADNDGKLNIRIDGLGVNGGTAVARTQAAVDGEDWFAVLYQRGTSYATGTFIQAKNVEPGKTYPIDVKVEFPGGGEEIVSGTVLVPASLVPPPVKGQLPTVIHHPIDTNKVGGKSETLEHRVEFGDGHEQPNARYGVSHELVVASNLGGKPDLPADIRSALRELKPFTVARAEDHVVLIGGNPQILAKNKNFRIKLLVTITPVETSGTGTVSPDGEDEPDWGKQ